MSAERARGFAAINYLRAKHERLRVATHASRQSEDQ